MYIVYTGILKGTLEGHIKLGYALRCNRFESYGRASIYRVKLVSA